LRRKSILALDDDPDISALIKNSLQRSGFNVFGFTDPHLALEHIKINAANYYLVISDLRMPGMNGFEFVRKVKEINPEIKVFLMTAFEINDQEFSNAISSLKVNEFITKPVSIKKLNAMVEKHTDILKTK
jgi:two-component system response regulator (stage 0 sporulation protein F)